MNLFAHESTLFGIEMLYFTFLSIPSILIAEMIQQHKQNIDDAVFWYFREETLMDVIEMMKIPREYWFD